MAAPAVDLFDLTPDPAILTGPDGARLRANLAFQRAFPHALAAARPPWGRLQPPPFIDDERTFEAASPDGRRYEWRERRLQDGSRMAVARDVTERVEAAELAARAKTVLFATLTHELRTPLNGVLGMAEILSQTLRASPEREYLKAIRDSGEHLLTLITDILDYARIESETFLAEERLFDPEAMAQSIAELLSPRAHEKGIDICVRAAPDTPRIIVADERRVRQILFNLVGNAIKFTAEGGVVVEVEAIDAARLRFTVRDTGPGVPKPMQMRIFEEFVQVDSSHARRYGGAGLGLAIVRKLATMLGGEVGMRNAPDRGSVFWVELPVRLAEPAPSRTQPLAGLTILIATTRDLLAATLSRTLTEAGARVARAQTEDCDLAVRPDVVLLDHALTLGALATFMGREAPVIVLAPQEDRAVLEGYRGQGFEHYLIKPVRRASLIARVLAVTRGDAGPIAPLFLNAATMAPNRRLRVLLAEDDPLNALIARTLLERAGCAVEVVENGAAAVEAVRTCAHDLVFLDLRMPVLDGIAAARRIRTLSGPAASTPLIALTADAGEGERTEALAAGMDDFLTKPIEPNRLEDVLARFTAPSNPAKLVAP